MAVGIIAFGSLVDDPGWEIEQATVRVDELEATSFPIEYARSSSSRDGAPTLVPVPTGGAAVPAKVLVLSDNVDLERTRDLLYRRETWWRAGPDSTYAESGATWIAEAPLPGLETALYTALRPNILGASPEKLAELAITSAQAGAGAEHRDGISYLINALAQGLKTPLSAGYQAAILAATSTTSLEEAWQRVTGSSDV